MKKKIITLSFIGFLSIVLWVFVALSEVYVTTIEAPVSFAQLPKNYSVGSSSVDQVFIQIKGRGWQLAKLYIAGTEDFLVSVHRRIGKHKNEIMDFVSSNPWLSSNFEVLEISPTQIEYEVEKVITKRVKLIKNINVEFRSGFAATSVVNINPEFIDIFGPSTILKSIDSINTEQKVFSDINENFNEQLAIEEIPGVTYSTKTCNIEFEVQKIVDKSFEGISVEIINVPKSKELILYPGKINVVIRGGINKLGKLSNDSIKAVVNYWRALKEDSGTIEPEIDHPLFTTLVAVEPKKIEYIIKQY